MTNKNYQSGRRKEYKIKKQLEESGCIVLRTAGSHGFADLVAINIEERTIKFIQCKPDKFSESEKQKLLSQYEVFHHHLWNSDFEVI
jgi:Holliday junction resolvase